MRTFSFICMTCLIAVSVPATASAQTNPDCIYPQWQWGQTGSVYHYYSEYVFMPNGMQDCSLSFWDNYDSGIGTLDTSGGCVSGSTDCEDPGIPNVVSNLNPKSDEKILTAVTTAQAVTKSNEYGSKKLNKDGYNGGLLKPSVQLKVNPKSGFKAKADKAIFVKILNADTVLYVKLFRTMLTDKNGNTLEGLTGVQISMPSKIQLTVDLSTSPDAWEKIADKCYVLILGRKRYVVRLAA